jgi:membrane protease YdiL (CAAX protease family)
MSGKLERGSARPAPRVRVATELLLLTAATVSFLLLFPERPNRVDVSLAVFALALLAANARYTRDEIWRIHPPPRRDPPGLGAWRSMALFTSAALIGLATWAAAEAWRGGGPAAVPARLWRPGALVAVWVYLPWALLQQTLFQFYLLGRLLALLPRRGAPLAVVATGLGYSLVHLPDLVLASITATSGVVWTVCYYRYRRLLPIAISHAVLGSAFYAWIRQREMLDALGALLERIG